MILSLWVELSFWEEEGVDVSKFLQFIFMIWFLNWILLFEFIFMNLSSSLLELTYSFTYNRGSFL